MANAVIMPKLGQTVEEAAIVKWHKQEGDAVAKGDILFEIETDKAVLEVESFYDGTLIKVYVPVNVTVPVSSTVGYIGEAGESVPDAPPASPVAAAAPAPEPAAAPEAPAPAASEPLQATPAAPAPADAGAPAAAAAPTPPPPTPAAAAPAARQFITPRAKALARAKGIDPSGITGTGPNGRVRESDVDAYLAANNYDALRVAPAARQLALSEKVDLLSVRGTGEGGRILIQDVKRTTAMRPQKMSRMRQVIASRLTQSFSGIPHFYVTVQADMTDLLSYRQELKAAGKGFSVNDFILEAVILSLEEMPAVNSTTDGKTVTLADVLVGRINDDQRSFRIGKKTSTGRVADKEIIVKAYSRRLSVVDRSEHRLLVCIALQQLQAANLVDPRTD